jgi:molecular chaperone GrpE
MKQDDSSNPAPPEAETLSATAANASAVQTELAAQKDRYLRLAADFENYKRRTAQESERRAAAQKDGFIVELLPVMDNLERALSARSSSADQLRAGVEMTLQQLDRLLRSHGCSPIEGCGQPFDPRWQEAIASRSDSAHGDHSVLEVVQRGWRRGDALLRPAKVIINDSARTTDDVSNSESRQPFDEATEQ